MATPSSRRSPDMPDPYAFLSRTRLGLADWLEEMAQGLEPGRFRFCAQGSLAPETGRQGLFATCFAVKTAVQAGLWEAWPEERKNACVAFILSFQDDGGAFRDPWLACKALLRLHHEFAAALLGCGPWSAVFARTAINVRAETRQAASTLRQVGAACSRPLPLPADDPTAVGRYARSLDWNHPWHAGSHFSHFLAMLSLNLEWFERPEDGPTMVAAALAFLEELRDAETGSWFRGRVDDDMKINGAMKVLTGLAWIEAPLPDPERLLDFALSRPFLGDGCGILNRLFVVRQAARSLNYAHRPDEVRELGLRALDVVKAHASGDGGFMFFRDKAQTCYYGAKISRGLPVGDLHAAMLFSWAAALSAEMIALGRKDPDGWQPQKP